MASRRCPRDTPIFRCRLKVLGIVDWSGSGKTTLLTAILPLLRHAKPPRICNQTHPSPLRPTRKDSFRHREAGAHEVLIASGTRWALLQEVEGKEPSFRAVGKRAGTSLSGDRSRGTVRSRDNLPLLCGSLP
jgi:energy-coupling factor transporter ATP-binding protein EcfA2